MTVEEISRRAKEKFIKAKKEFKDGDFFKVANKGKILCIGCFKSIDSDSYRVDINYHFLYFTKNGAIYPDYAVKIDFDTRDKAKNIPTNRIIRLLLMPNEGTYPVCVIICCFKSIELTSNENLYKASYDFMYIETNNVFNTNYYFLLTNDYNFKIEKPTYCDILMVKDLLMERKIKYNRKCIKICRT